MSKQNSKVILITGASSGIGFETAQTLARQGHKVYAAARRVELMEPLKSDGVKVLRMDVTEQASMAAEAALCARSYARLTWAVSRFAAEAASKPPAPRANSERRASRHAVSALSRAERAFPRILCASIILLLAPPIGGGVKINGG